MKYRSGLCQMTLRDMRRLFDVDQKLAAVVADLKLSRIGGAAAMVRLLEEAADLLEPIFVKGVPELVKRGQAGYKPVLDAGDQFSQAIIALYHKHFAASDQGDTSSAEIAAPAGAEARDSAALETAADGAGNEPLTP